MKSWRASSDDVGMGISVGGGGGAQDVSSSAQTSDTSAKQEMHLTAFIAASMMVGVVERIWRCDGKGCTPPAYARQQKER